MLLKRVSSFVAQDAQRVFSTLSPGGARDLVLVYFLLAETKHAIRVLKNILDANPNLILNPITAFLGLRYSHLDTSLRKILIIMLEKEGNAADITKGYTALLKSVAEEGDENRTIAMFSSMSRKGYDLGVTACNAAILGCQTPLGIESVLQVMKNLEIAMTAGTFVSLVEVLGHCDFSRIIFKKEWGLTQLMVHTPTHLEHAAELLYIAVVSNKVKQTIGLHYALLRAYRNGGDLRGSVACLKRAVDAGFVPSTEMFSVVFELLVARVSVSDGWKCYSPGVFVLLAESLLVMAESQDRAIPHHFTATMKVFAALSETEKAHELFARTTSRGVPPQLKKFTQVCKKKFSKYGGCLNLFQRYLKVL